MLYRVETGPHAGMDDTQGRKTAQRLRKDLNLAVAEVRQTKVFTVDGLDAAQVQRLLDEGVWHDPILQQAALTPLPLAQPAQWFVEVGFRPGVTDNEARTARDTAALVLGLPRESLRVYTSVQYRLSSDAAAPLGREQVEALARDLLCNTLIQRYRIKSAAEWAAEPGFAPQAAAVTGTADATVETIALSGMDDAALQQASRENTWALNLAELHRIRAHFTGLEEAARRAALQLPADPTDVEMEVLAQTWSEHCKHKIFAARIEYTDADTGRREVVDNLYKTCIRDATAILRERMGANDYCKSVFKDNAGVIAFINGYDACIKVETHNSPSALDPYGGALTGIVGVNRDPWARAWARSWSAIRMFFCFASPFYDQPLPPRLLHPPGCWKACARAWSTAATNPASPRSTARWFLTSAFWATAGLLRHCGPAAGRDQRPRRLVQEGGAGRRHRHDRRAHRQGRHPRGHLLLRGTARRLPGHGRADRRSHHPAQDVRLYPARAGYGPLPTPLRTTARRLSSSVGEMAEDTGGCVLDAAKAP
jgi:phosphoribosylformylglycinamidine synthase